ncbi:MAG: class I SAM-dependent methyltransferase [Spirochaetales bacterium]|nr:class I SAM-dependent methyltransferase [Spirochaetales bacterium]
MIRTEKTPLYEAPLWRDFNEGLRRPGGLELTDYALSLCGISAGARVLDVGCGGGFSVEYLSSRFGFITEGCDISDQMIEEARLRFPAKIFFKADTAAIPCSGGCYDAVLAECSLSICNDLSAALSEINRVLVAEGRLIITDMYLRGRGGAGTADNGKSCLQKLSPEWKWRKALQAEGFEILCIKERSSDLGSLIARIIFEFGSVENFYSEWLGGPDDCGVKDSTAKPGYFLAVCRKKGDL